MNGKGRAVPEGGCRRWKLQFFVRHCNCCLPRGSEKLELHGKHGTVYSIHPKNTPMAMTAYTDPVQEFEPGRKSDDARQTSSLRLGRSKQNCKKTWELYTQMLPNKRVLIP